MITEDVLERGLSAAAEGYDVPADAVERLREQIAPRVDTGPAADRPRRWNPSRQQWWAVAAAGLVALVVLPFALGGSTGTGESAGRASGPAAAGGASSEDAPAHRLSGGSATADKGAETPSFSKVVPGPVTTASERIVKTGRLELQVDKGDVTPTLGRLTALATFERGYVAESRTDEAGPSPSGTVTLRVPVAAFEDTVNRARGYGSKVLSLQTSAHDVTSEYVDLKARIRALRGTRNSFLDLLARATTIGQTLAVQQRVSDVQAQIERLQGQRKVLGSQSALSTLTVTVGQKAAAATTATHRKSGIERAVDRSVSRFVRGIEVMIGAVGPIMLVLLVAGLAWVAARVGYRLLRRRIV